jgi:acetylornithine deacetylase/succinyl-diaminopimelate desuccinylase-like protein
VKSAVDLVREQGVITLTQQLVRIRSQYSPDPADGVREHYEITAFLKDVEASLGLEIHYAEPAHGFPVVVARLRGNVGSPVLAFIGHYNTQPAGDRALWTVDPFGGEIRNGRIWGRGANDMKQTIAAAIEATRALIASGVERKGDLLHVWFPGEGAHDPALTWMAGIGRRYAGADWYLDMDGPAQIAKTAAPLIWVELRTRGRGGHPTVFLQDGSRPVNALNRLVRLLARIENVDDWMAYAPHPLYDTPWRTSPKPIVDITRVLGGAFDQVVEAAAAQISFNLLPGQTPERFFAELRALIDRVRADDPEFEPVEVHPIQMFYNARPWELSDDHPVVRAIHDVAQPILGYTPGFYGLNAGSRPPLWEVGDVITFGVPGCLDKAHTPDEHSTIEGVVKGTKVYAALMERLLT